MDLKKEEERLGIVALLRHMGKYDHVEKTVTYFRKHGELPRVNQMGV